MFESQIRKQQSFRKKAQENAQFGDALKTVLGEEKKTSPNPEASGNVRAVKAEEIILATLLKHPDYLKRLSGFLSAETFVTEYGRRFFTDIAERINSGRSLELYSFGESNENEEMAYLSYLLAKGESLANSVEECRQCAATLIEEKGKKNAPDIKGLSSEEYLQLFKNKRRNNKPEGV